MSADPVIEQMFDHSFKLSIRTTIKKLTPPAFFVFAAVLFLASCSRGITINEAANGKTKCGRYIR